MKYSLFICVVINFFINELSASCDNWEIYKSSTILKQKGLQSDIGSYVGRALISGTYVPGYIKDGKFYASHNGRKQIILNNFEYLVTDIQTNDYYWSPDTTQNCVANAIYVGDFLIGRNMEDSLIGNVVDKTLNIAEINSITTSDNYEVLTCKPKPCAGGNELIKCKATNDKLVNDFKQCEEDYKELEKETNEHQALSLTRKELLDKCEDDLSRCKTDFDIEGEVQKRVKVVQDQLNEERSKNQKLTHEIANLRENNVCSTSIPECVTLNPRFGPTLVENKPNYEACINYIDDRRYTSFSKVMAIRNKADEYLRALSPTVMPFSGEETTTPSGTLMRI